MKTAPLLCCALFALFCSPVAHAQPEGEVIWTEDWANAPVDVPVSKETSPYFSFVPYAEAHEVRVVDRNSQPANPFPDVEKALYIRRATGEKPPICRWGFNPDGGVVRGAVEIEFFVLPEEATRRAGLRFYLEAVQERDGRRFYAKCGHLRVMPGGLALMKTGEGEQLQAAGPKPRTGERNVLRLEWDLAGAGGFWATLNGEPVHLRDASASEPSIITIPEQFRTGIGGVSLMILAEQSGAFIGKVTAMRD